MLYRYIKQQSQLNNNQNNKIIMLLMLLASLLKLFDITPECENQNHKIFTENCLTKNEITNTIQIK